MNIIHSYNSPNYDQIKINVEFAVIHYTACDLESTLGIFLGKASKVSAHFVIAPEGKVYEMVPSLSGGPFKAWHAGKSRFESGNALLESFNDFSIGIELVNLNGNVFEYPESQYAALYDLVNVLKERFTALQNPERFVGHEQIAGFRGKVDPGWKFEWEKFYDHCFPGALKPERKPALPQVLKNNTEKIVANMRDADRTRLNFWQELNRTMEETTKIANDKK